MFQPAPGVPYCGVTVLIRGSCEMNSGLAVSPVDPARHLGLECLHAVDDQV